MRKTILLVVLIIAPFLSIFGQMTDNQSSKMSKTEQAVTALADGYAIALVKRDTAALERLLANDYMDISPDGFMSSKSDTIANFKNSLPHTVEAIETNDSKVRVYGDVAVLTARVTLPPQPVTGQAFNSVVAVTVVAMKKNGRWQIVSTHASRMPKANTSPLN